MQHRHIYSGAVLLKSYILNPEVCYHIIQTSGVKQNQTDCCPSVYGSLLIVRPIATLIWVVGSRHLTLGRRTLHSWRWGPSRSWPHSRTQPSRLAEWGTEGALVFGELLHGVGVIVMRRWSVDRGATVLGRRSWGRVVHVRGQLAHDVPRWRGDWWRSCGHGGRRGLVVHHVWCPRALRRMLHGVADWRRRRRWGPKVLLWWRHHVVRVSHYRGLARIVPWMVVGRLTRAWSRVWLTRRGVILNGHGDEIAVFACCYRGNAECLRTKTRGWGRAVMSRGRGWLTVGVMAAVLERVGEVNVVFRQVRRRHAEPFRDLR